jgi:cell division protein FtsA
MAVNRNLAVGVDAGSSRTRCVIGILDEGYLRLLGYGEAASVGGWVKGRLSDQTAVRDSILDAVQEAERKAGVTVDAAVAGIGGVAIESSNSRGVYEFGRPREVQGDDMTYAVELASRVRLEEGRIVLQVLPQDFTVDGRAGYRNPRGVTCSRLEANVHVISALVHDHNALVAAMHQAHLSVEETIFEGMAAAYACLLEEDRRQGVALIDIGAQTTDIVIYDGEALLRAGSLNVGGDHFTRDAAYGLCVGYDDAESLKLQYGAAFVGLTPDTTLIEVPSAEGRPPREAPRKHLNEILEARAEELFYFVRSEVQRVGMEQSLLEGVVLTGGGARLHGMCDIAERMLNCQARNGLAVGMEGWVDEINDPAWATAAGLAMYSARLKTKKEFKRKIPGLRGLILR